MSLFFTHKRIQSRAYNCFSHVGVLYALYDSKYFAIWDLSSSSTNIEPEIVDLASKFGSRILKMSLCGTSYIVNEEEVKL